MQSKDELIRRAAVLSRLTPVDWAKFLEAFATYTDEIRDQCIKAPVGVVQVNQGRAQNCSELFETFRDVKKLADTLEQRSVKPPAQPARGV